MEKSYIVMCRDDRHEDGTPGGYSQATRKHFPTQEAAEQYASGISTSREPFIIQVDPNSPVIQNLNNNDFIA